MARHWQELCSLVPLVYYPGLQDGLFSNQKFQCGYIWEGLGMENVVIFHTHLEYITAIRHSLWPFGNFVVICGNIFPCWYIVSTKIRY
jgi:hypothetical protein